MCLAINAMSAINPVGIDFEHLDDGGISWLMTAFDGGNVIPLVLIKARVVSITAGTATFGRLSLILGFLLCTESMGFCLIYLTNLA